MSRPDVEALAKKLGVDPDDRPAMLAFINARRAQIHPDTNGGTFASAEAEAEWHQLNKIVDYLTSHSSASGAVITVDEVARHLALIARGAGPSIAQREATVVEHARERAARHVALPRIGSGVFAALCGALFTFGQGLMEHPVFGPYVGTQGFFWLWGSLCVYSGAFFVFTWWAEQRAIARLEYWASDQGLRELAARLGYASSDVPKHERIRRFRRSRVLDIIQGRQSTPFNWITGGIDRKAATEVAELQLDRMLETEVVTRLPGRTLDPVYEFTLEDDAID